MRLFALTAIRFYQVAMSPYLPGVCRYVPTCSQYVYEAVLKYGVVSGLLLGVQRIGRCRPRGSNGYDPVP